MLEKLRPYLTPPVRQTLALACLVLVVLGTATGRQLAAREKACVLGRVGQLTYLPSPSTLRMATLGFRNFAADLIWARALVYAGTHLARRTSIRWLPNYVHTIIKLDPKFRMPYEWGSTLMVYNRKAPTWKNIRRSMKILELGRKQFPNDYYFSYALGIALVGGLGWWLYKRYT